MLTYKLPQVDYSQETRNMSLMDSICTKTLKAYAAFERSLGRIRNLSSDPGVISDDEEERWEAYCSRFARLQDMLVKRFFRALALAEDPAWSGSVRDLLNLMEKRAIISSAAEWMALRELRNEMAHEYEDSALQALQERARAAAPLLIAVKPKVDSHASY